MPALGKAAVVEFRRCDAPYRGSARGSPEAAAGRRSGLDFCQSVSRAACSSDRAAYASVARLRRVPTQRNRNGSKYISTLPRTLPRTPVPAVE